MYMYHRQEGVVLLGGGASSLGKSWETNALYSIRNNVNLDKAFMSLLNFQKLTNTLDL